MRGAFRKYKRSRLTKEQFAQLADYLSNLSLLFIGSIVTPIFANEKISLFYAGWGILLTIVFFGASMELAKRSS